MKRVQILATTIAIAIITGSAFAQGSLIPPGAPGATMKTLEQVEPRTPISGTYIITQPGSYYLTGNINGKITIRADNVTLDLMGFYIISSSMQAIVIPSGYGENTFIHNGTLRSAANYTALYAYASNNCRFENLRIDGRNNSSGGIYVNDNSVVRNCDVQNCTSSGIRAGDKTEIRDCRVNGITNDGIKVENGCRIIDNVIEGCGDDGIYISGSKNYLSGNIVKGNVDNYHIAAGNQLNILLCEIPEELNWPCSVKLSGTLVCTNNGVNGITIAANDVTIDLDGHTLIGPGESSGNGIYQSSTYYNLTVRNGNVRGWQGTYMCGFSLSGSSSILSDLKVSINDYGMSVGANSTISKCIAVNNDTYGITSTSGCTLSDCTAYNNGNDGIFAFDNCTLSDCTACYNNGTGIRTSEGCTISECAAYNNDSVGIYADDGSTISSCTAYKNGGGIYTGDGSTISDCSAHNNINDGISVSQGSTIKGCTAFENDKNGIKVSYKCRITGCTCDSNGNNDDGAGILATSSDNRIDGNTVTDNDRGIDVDNDDNFIVRNTASGNTVNYDIVANNKVGVIVSAPNSAAISGDTGGTGVGSTDPWANFTF